MNYGFGILIFILPCLHALEWSRSKRRKLEHQNKSAEIPFMDQAGQFRRSRFVLLLWFRRSGFGAQDQLDLEYQFILPLKERNITNNPLKGHLPSPIVFPQ